MNENIAQIEKTPTKFYGVYALIIPIVLVFVGYFLFGFGVFDSKLISDPGIAGRFIEDSTGKPIAGVKVVYTNVADGLTKESTTDADGQFIFQPEFTYDYAGYPTSPLGLQVTIELRIREKHNFNSGYHFVNNTDIDHATIDAGDIRVNKVFLSS